MKIKLWISLVLAFLVFVFIVLNSKTVHVNFLVKSIDMSLVLLLFIVLGIGIIIGWLLNSYVRYVIKKGKEPAATSAVATGTRTGSSAGSGQMNEVGDKPHES